MFLTQIINGKVTELALCAQCAKERGLFDPQSLTFAEKFFPEEFKNRVEKLVHELSDGKSGGKQQGSASSNRLDECPACKFTLEDYRRSGHFGCPDCYRVFASELNPERLPEADAPAQELSPAHHRTRLEQELADAIEREDYERAAELRDQLKNLQ